VKKKLTTAVGAPVPDNQNTMTAGPRGPALLQDVWFLEKLAHFDREVIPERLMHAKGSAAFGTFTVTHDITRYTKASPCLWRRRTSCTGSAEAGIGDSEVIDGSNHDSDFLRVRLARKRSCCLRRDPAGLAGVCPGGNSLCAGQEKRTMHKPEVKIGYSG